MGKNLKKKRIKKTKLTEELRHAIWYIRQKKSLCIFLCQSLKQKQLHNALYNQNVSHRYTIPSRSLFFHASVSLSTTLFSYGLVWFFTKTMNTCTTLVDIDLSYAKLIRNFMCIQCKNFSKIRCEWNSNLELGVKSTAQQS